MKNNIIIENVSKRYGAKEVLKNISFEAKAGRVTAFLGANGAGKSSTLRILFGLNRASAGTAKFVNQTYTQLKEPLKTVGAMFDGISGLSSRKVITHLKIIAEASNIPKARVLEVLELTEMSNKKQERLGTLSLGEGQRLNLAVALLGNPQYLVMDEPMNGLDPSGIRWLRKMIRSQADQGKTVLLSSHLLAEVEAVADDVVIIANGEIVANGEISTIMQDLNSLEDVFFALTDGGL